MPKRALPHLFVTWVLLLAAAFQVVCQAETVKDRKAAVLDDRTRMQEDERWIYNDWQHGFTEAKRTGKPLLVVLRCVPCLACAGIDASILGEQKLQPVLDQFVCVRLINANAIDLSLFQFDYDLSFSALFFNGDGTVYGRYGSWTHQKDPYEKSTTGFKRAMESALALHRDYPRNKDSLAGKQGKPMPVKDPLELPTIAGKYTRELDWNGKVVQSCVHCHQVSDAVRVMYRREDKTIPQRWVYPMPAPETIGLKLAADAPARVESIELNSIAAKAGILVGDEIVLLDAQSPVSIADIAWALHHAPDRGILPARVKRGSVEHDLEIELTPGWRNKSDISRRVGTWAMRAMATGGMLLKDLPDQEREQRGLSPSQLALHAEHVGEYGEHAAAKKAGFRKNDVLVEVDGISERMTESELIGHLIGKKAPGDKIKARVLRDGRTLDLAFPIQ